MLKGVFMVEKNDVKKVEEIKKVGSVESVIDSGDVKLLFKASVSFQLNGKARVANYGETIIVTKALSKKLTSAGLAVVVK